jgi:hypothetical protein
LVRAEIQPRLLEAPQDCRQLLALACAVDGLDGLAACFDVLRAAVAGRQQAGVHRYVDGQLGHLDGGRLAQVEVVQVALEAGSLLFAGERAVAAVHEGG